MSADGAVLVTGATGMLGRVVTRRLVEAGLEVRVLVRPGRTAPPGTTAVPAADLADATALARGLAGARTLVHLAARTHVMRETEADALSAYRRINVEATTALLDAALRAGVERVLFASSVKAVAECAAAPLGDEAPPRPSTPYGVTKLQAEDLIMHRTAASGGHGVVLRFPLIYGPGVRGNVLRLFEAVHRGRPIPVGGVRNRRSILGVDNAAAAVLAAIASPPGSAGRYFVRDDRDVSTPEFVRAIGDALGRKARLLPLPLGLFRVAALIGDRVERLLPFPLTGAVLERLVGSLAVDDQAARRALGYQPVATLEEGLATTAAWFASRARGVP